MNRLFPIMVLPLVVGIAVNRLADSKKGRKAVLPGSRSVAMLGMVGAEPVADKDRKELARGKELFTREWLVGDGRSHAGDGLGPLYNARSCAACHNLGGIGGAGAKHTNATIVSVFLVQHDPSGQAEQPDRSKLAQIHPALLTENSFPLHRFGTDKEFAKWRRELVSTGGLGLSGIGGGFGGGNFGGGFGGSGLKNPEEFGQSSLGSFSFRHIGNSMVQFVGSERNAPPLFGLGLIDRIPPQVLEEIAAAQSRAAQKDGSEKRSSAAADSRLSVLGRVSRLKDGRLGRFGLKGQIATLREFTIQACAQELGLEVPGFPQTAPPWNRNYKAPGLDLTADQCNALVKFVGSLPPPIRKPAESEQHAVEIAAGQKLFERIGCAVCHQPKLGEVEGIYSDLLLHDMGQSLTDNGVYGGSIIAGESGADRIDPVPVLNSGQDAARNKPKFGASAREWRTPPLWGLRDSGPYLHDGRADTIGAAIAFHDGEGFDAADKFRGLSLRERHQIELFLQSLALPE